MANEDSSKDQTLKTLEDYYRFITPQDMQGRYAFKSAESSKKVNPEAIVFEKYVNSRTTGEQIIKTLKEQQNSPGRGYLYNTVYQTRGNSKCEFLEDQYWRPSKRPKESNPNDNKDKTLITDFYKQVCGSTDVPVRDFSVNVLRAPFLSNARANTSEVEFFLNYIPSVFASQLVPYFDVEFELPNMSTQNNGTYIRDINRPSLLRFLVGSPTEATNAAAGKPSIPLTDADLALMSPFRTPTKGDPRAESYFLGMEMFTTPQTLTNMDSLSAGAARLLDVKPFLPPASFTGATIQMLNAGAGQFVHKKADVEIKIHDKARLVEFSEFLQGPAGYRGVTVWLTYGWLAPRGGDTDEYAKFINNNMLVREAFTVKNSSFSFDAVGQVSVKIELVSKGFTTIENSVIHLAKPDDALSIAREIPRLLADIRKYASALGTPPVGSQDIRIYQVLDAAVAGNIDFEISEAEVGSLFRSARNSIKNSRTIARKADALKLIDKLEVFFEKQGGDKSRLKEALRKEVTEYISELIAICKNNDSPDPFLPQESKSVGTELLFSNDLVSAMKQSSYIEPETNPTTWKAIPVPNKFYDPSKPAVGQGVDKKTWENDHPEGPAWNPKVVPKKINIEKYYPPIRDQVSFGKLFSVFCMPSLLRAAAEEEIDEVQVNFYQLNDSCGPVSLHSIAEFPIDLADFEIQLADFAVKRGGEAMNVQEFLRFVSDNQFADPRALAYGMREYYQPYTLEQPDAVKGGSDATFNSNMTKWFGKYGAFKKPIVSIKMETGYESDNLRSNVDLLYQIQSTVASAYNESSVKIPGKKKIKKIHIYDKQHNPFLKSKNILQSADGSYIVYEGEPITEVIEKYKKQYGGGEAEDAFTAFLNAQYPNVKVNKPGVNVLRDYVENTVPTLTIGSNGTLITTTTLSSKADGLIGTNNMLGGSFKAKSTLAPNGLSMAENNIPLRIVPAQLTMTSMGCPIADIYQSFFINFGTGTTLDNLYTCTQLSHTFAPGKFESNWTFAYTDGYGKYFGATKLTDALKEIASKEDATKEKEKPPTVPTK